VLIYLLDCRCRNDSQFVGPENVSSILNSNPKYTTTQAYEARLIHMYVCIIINLSLHTYIYLYLYTNRGC
jgi:hypothetical protein